MNRRDFLWFTGVATGSVSISSLMTSCAFDPVTGEAMLSLVSEEQEIAIDRQQSPHQFSADYGENSDRRLNSYLSQVGQALAKTSHRPQMPYSYRVLDANHVNAYTFPGGTMAVTRGIMVEMESEAELAALLGHEIGHVNARHAAERATKGMLAQTAVGVAASTLGSESAQKVVAGVGMISATALLAKYSRDNEREADHLGMDYAVNAGANPQGMVDLMTLLNSLHSQSPNAMQIMFSSHPMSDERLRNANDQMASYYSRERTRNMGRERYMDYTQALRKDKALIQALAKADLAVSGGQFDEASEHLARAKAERDNDYALWIISAKNNMGLGRHRQAVTDLTRAKSLKPAEQLALYMQGASYLELGDYDPALASFQSYQQRLPGNPMVNFFIGYSYEGLGNRAQAATAYQQFLRQVQQGEQAEHAYRSLKEWGYVS